MKSFKKFQANTLNKVQQQQLKGGRISCGSGVACQGEPGRNYPAR